MYSDAVVLQGSDKKYQTLGSFYNWVKGASFFVEEYSSPIEVVVEMGPVVIQTRRCDDCIKKLHKTKILDSMRVINWREIDADTLKTIVSCICAVFYVG